MLQRPQIIRRRNPFVFPAGVAPGFDPTHVAGKAALSWCASYPLVNLVGGVGSFADSNLKWGLQPIGPVAAVGSSTSNSGGITFPPPGGLTSQNVTFAGIFEIDLIGYPYQAAHIAWVTNGSSTCSFGVSTNGSVPSLSVLSSYMSSPTGLPTLVLGHAYFAVVAFGAATSCNVVVTDLMTGQIWTVISTANGANFTGSGIGVASSGNVTGSNKLGIATSAVIPCAMSVPAMKRWASDPWSFWYPRRAHNLVGVSGSTFAVTVNSGSLLEFVTILQRDKYAQAEVVSALRGDTAKGAEIIAALRDDAISPAEAIAALRSNVLGDAELLAGLLSDIVFPTEFIGGQRRDAGAVIEVLPKVSSDAALEMENLGALSVTGDAPLQLEGTAKFSADANSQTESSAAVLASSGSAVELLIKVTSDRAALGEALAALSASPISEVEITVGVQASAAEPVETSVRVTVDRVALIEILSGVSREQGAPVEIIALTAGVIGNAVLAFEILGGLAGGSPVALELRGNSFILGRLLKNSKTRVRSLQNQKARVRSLSNLKTRD